MAFVPAEKVSVPVIVWLLFENPERETFLTPEVVRPCMVKFLNVLLPDIATLFVTAANTTS